MPQQPPKSSRTYALPYRNVFRPQLVLLAARGLRNDEIAERFNGCRDVASMWRKRFFSRTVERLLRLEAARPFEWAFTRGGLARLVGRMATTPYTFNGGVNTSENL